MKLERLLSRKEGEHTTLCKIRSGRKRSNNARNELGWITLQTMFARSKDSSMSSLLLRCLQEPGKSALNPTKDAEQTNLTTFGKDFSLLRSKSALDSASSRVYSGVGHCQYVSSPIQSFFTSINRGGRGRACGNCRKIALILHWIRRPKLFVLHA
jgi:hypothetical protein